MSEQLSNIDYESLSIEAIDALRGDPDFMSAAESSDDPIAFLKGGAAAKVSSQLRAVGRMKAEDGAITPIVDAINSVLDQE